MSRWVLDVAMRVLFFPLEILYFHGPKLWGYGFYEGGRKETICSEVTGVRSGFWSDSQESFTECEDLLRRKFHAFVIGFVAITTTISFLQIGYLILCRHIILKSLSAKIYDKK
jgi:hypothetical protein